MFDARPQSEPGGLVQYRQYNFRTDSLMGKAAIQQMTAKRLAIIGANEAIASVRAKPKIALPNNCLDNPGFRDTD